MKSTILTPAAVDRIIEENEPLLALEICKMHLKPYHYNFENITISPANLLKLDDRFGFLTNKKTTLLAPQIYNFVQPQYPSSYKQVYPKKQRDWWPSNFVVIAYDCEIENDSQEVVLVSFCLLDKTLQNICYADKFKNLKDEFCMYTSDLAEFTKFVIDTMCYFKNVFLVAHNGAKFDHFWICRSLQSQGIKMNLYSSSDDATNNEIMRGEAYFPKSECSIYFRDTYRYFMSSLKNCGNFLNCEKLEATTDAGGLINITKENALDEKNILYCCRDTKIVVLLLRWLRDVFGKELEKYDICKKDYFIEFTSQAEMAYNMALTTLYETPIYAFDRLTTEEFRRALYGARVDSMIYGQEYRENEIQGIDVRSMYPASLNRPVRGGNIHKLTNDEKKVEFWAEYPLHHIYPMMAFVVLSKTATSCYDKFFGILPIKIKKASQWITVYASEGRICGWYTDIDIFNAQRDGWKLEKVIQGWRWDYWVKDLSNFYRQAYNNRKTTDKKDPINALEKIKMNSSYGKFGQLQDKFDWLDDDELDKSVVENLQFIADLNDEPNTALTVCIDCLSWSRIQMCTLKHMCTDHNVYYTDTDSLYLDKPFVDELKVKYPERFENNLSENLDVCVDSETVYNAIIVLGKKLYCCGDKNCKNKPLVRAKGHKGDKVSYEIMQDALDGKYVTTSRSSHVDTKWTWDDEQHKIINFNTGKWITLQRRLQISIPPYKYLCEKCNHWHTTYIDNCGACY